MNVHLFPNQKFVKNFVSEVLKHGNPMKNTFVIREEGSTITSDDRFTYLSSNEEIVKFIATIDSQSTLIIHFLDQNMLRLLPRLKWTCKIAWGFWGAEFYKILHHKGIINLFDPITASIERKQEGRGLIVNIPFGAQLMQVRNHLLYKKLTKNFELFISKLDFFYNFNQHDYHLLKKHFETNAEFKFFFFANFALFQKSYEHQLSTNQNSNLILIGNSGSLTNNHIDVFEKVNDDKLQFIIPLGYGKPFYINNLAKFFSTKENVKILLDYLPLDEYNKMLMNVNSCVMGHNRAEGLGNIHVLLYSGKKIFLKENTTTYRYLLDLGLQVFPLEKCTTEEMVTPLTKNEITHNQKILKDFIGYDKLVERYQNLFA